MKFPAKTLLATLISAAIAGPVVASDTYTSTVMPTDRSYNDIDVSKQMQSTQGSYNRSLDVDADLDVNASRNAYDSFNRSQKTSTDIDASRSAADSFNRSAEVNTDASRMAYDSFNRSKEVNTDIDTDSSKTAYDSFNSDYSNRDWSTHDSFNSADHSIKDSYNQRYETKQKWLTDTMAVSPELNAHQQVSSGDTQGASNSGYMTGHTQSGRQGGVAVGGVGNDAPTIGLGGYGGGDFRSFTNNQAVRNDGPNLGAIANTSVVNQGRDLVFGPNRSMIGNDIGPKMSNIAGEQTQLQKNDQFKNGDQSATAGNSIDNEATKSSSGL